jgi:hypothetical protein
VFGERAKFVARWHAEDCAGEELVSRLREVGLFLAHGARDEVVRPDQLATMRSALEKAGHPRFEVVLDPTGGHDIGIQSKQLPAAFEAMRLSFERPR